MNLFHTLQDSSGRTAPAILNDTIVSGVEPYNMVQLARADYN